MKFMARVRVWDLPTRLVHWLLAVSVAGSIASGYAGGSWIDWHARLGYAAFAMLLFRLVWGLVGGRWSRFSSFAYSPRATLSYLRGRAHPDQLVGHNPLGAWSVFALLLVIAAQVATGLVADDEISFTGPLNRFVASGRALSATWYHKEVGQLLLIALVVLHIAALLFYLVVRKQNLVRAMVAGDKELDATVPPSRDDWKARALAALLAACAVAVVTWVIRLGSQG